MIMLEMFRTWKTSSFTIKIWQRGVASVGVKLTHGTNKDELNLPGSEITLMLLTVVNAWD